MEKRKLVKSGDFSLTVSLPKGWIERHRLGKGSEVTLLEKTEKLIIFPEKPREKTEERNKQYVLSTDNAQINSLIRDITAAYLTNKGNIKIIGKDLKKTISKLKKTISHYPGLEVIEETNNALLVKDYINIDELIIPDLVRRSDNIIRSLFLDGLECLETEDKDLAAALEERDQEVNRQTFLIYKCLNYINEHPSEGKIHGIEPKFSTHIWELNGYLEKIGDEIKRFTRLTPKSGLSVLEKKKIGFLLKKVEQFYTDIMTALYKKDPKSSDAASLNRKNIRKEFESFTSKSKSFTSISMVSKLNYLLSFINSISRISRYISFEKHRVIQGPIFLSKQNNEPVDN
ncbi:MAG: phosphate uptake regulator PhoU [archaeon]